MAGAVLPTEAAIALEAFLTRSNLFFTGDTHGQIAGRHRIEDRGFLLLNKLIRVCTLE